MEVGLIHANNQLLIDTLNAVIQQLINHPARDRAHSRTAVGAIILRIQSKRADGALSTHSVLETPDNKRVPGAAAAPRRKNYVVAVLALFGAQIQSLRNLCKNGSARSNEQGERQRYRSESEAEVQVLHRGACPASASSNSRS